MKKTYPTREKNRWEHALVRPLHRLPFEMIELMRADLFEYLDVLTTDPYKDKSRKDRIWRDREIQRIAARLKQLTPYRVRVLQSALEAGSVEWTYLSGKEAARVPSCGPFSTWTWEQVHQLWEDAR